MAGGAVYGGGSAQVSVRACTLQANNASFGGAVALFYMAAGVFVKSATLQQLHHAVNAKASDTACAWSPVTTRWCYQKGDPGVNNNSSCCTALPQTDTGQVVACLRHQLVVNDDLQMRFFTRHGIHVACIFFVDSSL